MFINTSLHKCSTLSNTWLLPPPYRSHPAASWAWTRRGSSGSRCHTSLSHGDLLLPVCQVGGSGVGQLLLHPRPDIFNWVQVWTVAGPVHQFDVGPLLKPFLNDFLPVAEGPIPQEMGVGVEPHEELQLFV